MPTASHPSSAAPSRLLGSLSPRRAATIAGVAYVIQYVTSVFPLFYLRPMLIAAGDPARTASNILAHEQLFRAAILLDVFTVAVLVVLNWALYELLAPVHLGLARLAAFFRLVEIAEGAALAVTNFIVLSFVDGAAQPGSLEARDLEGLVRVFVGVHTAGYNINLVFFGIGSTIYMYLLWRSRYVPRVLSMPGMVGSALAPVVALSWIVVPQLFAAASVAIRSLPVLALVALGAIAAPLLLLELVLGLWLTFKGVRADRSP